jgi:hypothetical protein
MTDAIETTVPDEESPTRCPHCGRPFADETYRTLHEGVAHYDCLDDERRASFADAYETEQAAIRLFRLKALAALVVLYFGFLWAYSVFG